MKYFKLTDTCNAGKLTRFDAGNWEEYNVATGKWESTCIMFQYLDPDSVYSDLFEEISESDITAAMQATSTEWKSYWNTAKTVVQTQYAKLPSPISDMNYDKYATWLADFARNEYERVLFALSGIDLLSNTEQVLAKLKLPDMLADAVRNYHYHGDDAILFQSGNANLLSAVLFELSLLVDRGDLVDPDKLYQRYARLKAGYSIAEAYASVSI